MHKIPLNEPFRRLYTLLFTAMALLTVTSAVSASEPSARSQAENRFVERLRSWPGTEEEELTVDLDGAEEYLDDILKVTGDSYHLPQVSSSTYYVNGDAEEESGWLLDAEYPAESMANIFLLPWEIARMTPMELTVLTHEYGTKCHLSTTVDKFVSFCEAAGCRPFFGVEKVEGDMMEGVLFMYNPEYGYDHVVRLGCNVREVIEQGAPVEARVSLFVPTDNVENLFQQKPESTSKARRYLDSQVDE